MDATITGITPRVAIVIKSVSASGAINDKVAAVIIRILASAAIGSGNQSSLQQLTAFHKQVMPIKLKTMPIKEFHESMEQFRNRWFVAMGLTDKWCQVDLFRVCLSWNKYLHSHHQQYSDSRQIYLTDDSTVAQYVQDKWLVDKKQICVGTSYCDAGRSGDGFQRIHKWDQQSRMLLLTDKGLTNSDGCYSQEIYLMPSGQVEDDKSCLLDTQDLQFERTKLAGYNDTHQLGVVCSTNPYTLSLEDWVDLQSGYVKFTSSEGIDEEIDCRDRYNAKPQDHGDNSFTDHLTKLWVIDVKAI
ncbi:OLC1v1024156C1 [Oldenlandia corymbosa var. corymbosa]|uniref:OLC1v1024156C1 n=1 Tax=Oldenlandia corymbosa var. corymbosa TaxID=529605 RepID=A0AAV1C400_OLDCO|nr:OLC1v1024156C1 [Oldenlandia corymbosa var. corymbosa]